ncbi:MAG TPA: hypothetical protein VM240_01950 [Verrucomicrobiae bacterium]|nr:hypothetical protein [Verrucomicrobiae bacterium]
MVYCILAYPVLVHLSVLTGSPALASLALVFLYAGFTLPALARQRPWAWATLALVALGSVALARTGASFVALKLPPILLPLAMAAWWAPTLRAGRTPFITVIARKIRGALSPEHERYTRGVTGLWVAVFIALAALGVVTAAFGTPRMWSLLTNFVSPILIGLVFALEYSYRRWHLRHEPHPGFIEFLRQVARAGVRPGARSS